MGRVYSALLLYSRFYLTCCIPVQRLCLWSSKSFYPHLRKCVLKIHPGCCMSFYKLWTEHLFELFMLSFVTGYLHLAHNTFCTSEVNIYQYICSLSKVLTLNCFLNNIKGPAYSQWIKRGAAAVFL